MCGAPIRARGRDPLSSTVIITSVSLAQLSASACKKELFKELMCRVPRGRTMLNVRQESWHYIIRMYLIYASLYTGVSTSELQSAAVDQLQYTLTIHHDPREASPQLHILGTSATH